MNNQKSQSFPKTNLDHLRKTSPYLQLRSFTFFCTTWSLLRTILDSASWWLSQSCDSYAAAFCCTNVGPNCTGNSGILVSGKIRMAPRPSKTTTARWPWSNLTDVPVAVKCQINNQLKPKLPQLKPESPWGNCWLPTTSQLHLFCTTWSLLRTILDSASWWLSQSCNSYAVAFCVEMWPNNKHSSAEHLWHVASTTSSEASLRVERLGWLPSQAKLPRHIGWHCISKLCH